MLQFLKDKFEILLITALFVFVFIVWIKTDFNPQVNAFLLSIFGAMLALLRIVPRPSTNITTDTVQTDNLNSASTENGDIITNSDTRTNK